MAKKSYLFDCGNSTDGPIGFCARIQAKDEPEAVAILENFLNDNLHFQQALDMKVSEDCRQAGVEYVTIYFGSENLTPNNIRQSETEDVCDVCGWGEDSCSCKEEVCAHCLCVISECECPPEPSIKLEDEECGCCGAYHRVGYIGDCRNDKERFCRECEFPIGECSC